MKLCRFVRNPLSPPQHVRDASAAYHAAPCTEHVPELRRKRNYDGSVVLGDAWVCARCEEFLRWVTEEEKR